MTGAIPLWSDASDGDLARAAAEGDRQAFAEIYDRYADRLYDFCVGTIGDRDAAADCVQDSFCVAATDLNNLREPDKLRPWLYSIARHQAMRRLRHRYREESFDDIPDVASRDAGPDVMAGQSELARLVAEAAGGLSDSDRELLELHYRHELDGPELAEALGITLTSANTKVFRLRQTIERSLGALLVARGARANTNACPELVTMLKGWDGQLTVLMRKRIARHIESCHTCQQEQRRQVNPVALLGGAPVFISAPDRLREQTLDRVQLTSADSTMPTSAAGPGTSPRVWPRTALLVGVPLVCLGLAIVWFAPREVSITPTIQVEPGATSDPPPPTTEAATFAPASTLPVQPPPSSAARTAPPTPRSPTTPEPRTPQPTPDESTPNPLPPGGSPEPPPESTPEPPVEDEVIEEDEKEDGKITEGTPDPDAGEGESDEGGNGKPITEATPDPPPGGGQLIIDEGDGSNGKPITEGAPDPNAGHGEGDAGYQPICVPGVDCLEMPVESWPYPSIGP